MVCCFIDFFFFGTILFVFVGRFVVLVFLMMFFQKKIKKFKWYGTQALSILYSNEARIPRDKRLAENYDYWVFINQKQQEKRPKQELGGDQQPHSPNKSPCQYNA